MAFLDELPGPQKKTEASGGQSASGCPIPNMSGISTNKNLREDLKPIFESF